MADAAADMEDLVLDATRALRAGHAADYHQFSDREVAMVRQRLLAWYDANKRSMPWRKEPLVVRLTSARNRLDLHCAGAYSGPALPATLMHSSTACRRSSGTTRSPSVATKVWCTGSHTVHAKLADVQASSWAALS